MIWSDPAAVGDMRDAARNLDGHTLVLNRTEAGCLQILGQILEYELAADFALINE